MNPSKLPQSSGKKIAVFAPSAPPAGYGGVVIAHYYLSRVLRQLGCEVTLLTFNETSTAASEPHLLRAGASEWLRKLLGYASFFYLRLSGSKKPVYQLLDIVTCQVGARKNCRALAGIAADFVIIPDHGAPGLMLPRVRPPVILVVHHSPARFAGNPLLGDCCPIDVEKSRRLEQRVLDKVDAVVCPSRYMKQVFQEHYVFSGPVEVIPNLIDEEYLAAITLRDIRRELNLPVRAPIIYIPSAGSELKGANYLFEIVRRLAIAAQGPVGFYLSGTIGARLAAELGRLPGDVRVYMPGALPISDNIAVLKGCDFGVSPTLIESFGMALLEAGFCGVPMVTFDVGGNSELIREGENGFLVPLLDIEALVAKAAALFDGNLLAALRLSTGNSVKRRYDQRSIASLYLELGQRLCDEVVRRKL
jgi:glycosyltransferase involved in cell wall biosynthesis